VDVRCELAAAMSMAKEVPNNSNHSAEDLNGDVPS